jgi:hypothetical protein
MLNLDEITYHLTETWPSYTVLSSVPNSAIVDFMKKIYTDGVFIEIGTIMTKHPGCKGVGHIVLISICSAIDSLSAYAFGGGGNKSRFTNFISAYFPANYKGKEQNIYESFRCDSVHGWNLHKSTISGIVSDSKHLSLEEGIIRISLYDFFNDFVKASENYYQELKKKNSIKDNFLKRYKELGK